MKLKILALPIILCPAFNVASAQDSSELVYQDILDSYLSENEVVATARFYNSTEDYEIVPIFSIDENKADTVLSRDNGKSWAIQSYSAVGDDYFQLYRGGHIGEVGTIHIETPNFCTSDGLATVSLRAKVRPSMSDLAKVEDNLSDMEFVLSKIFSRYVDQALGTVEYKDDIYATYQELILYPALTSAASEFETRYDVTIADTPDLVAFKGISVTDMSKLMPQERKRICPNPVSRL